MLSKYFVHNVQLHKAARWFGCGSITRGLNQTQKNTETTQQSDNILGK